MYRTIPIRREMERGVSTLKVAVSDPWSRYPTFVRTQGCLLAKFSWKFLRGIHFAVRFSRRCRIVRSSRPLDQVAAWQFPWVLWEVWCHVFFFPSGMGLIELLRQICCWAWNSFPAIRSRCVLPPVGTNGCTMVIYWAHSETYLLPPEKLLDKLILYTTS